MEMCWEGTAGTQCAAKASLGLAVPDWSWLCPHRRNTDFKIINDKMVSLPDVCARTDHTIVMSKTDWMTQQNYVF